MSFTIPKIIPKTMRASTAHIIIVTILSIIQANIKPTPFKFITDYLFVLIYRILFGSVDFNVNCELVGFFVTFEEKHINRNSNESNGNYETEYIYFYIACKYSAYIVDNK